METYSFLRGFADSWALLVMTALFVGVVLYALRPGARPIQQDAANSIFRNEKAPKPSVADSTAGSNYKDA